MNFFRGKRGQLSIINIVMFVILIIIAAVLTPVAGSIIDSSKTAMNVTAGSSTDFIMNSIIPLMWVGIIATFFLYLTPISPRQY